MRTLSASARSTRILVGGFALVACVVLVQDVVNHAITSRVATRSQRIATDSVHSIELLDRIVRDIDRQRIIVDDHIFETSLPAMVRVESELAGVNGDLAAARAEYASIVGPAGEEPAWRRAQASLDRLVAPLAATLAFSRMNRNVESREKWLETRPDYEDLDHDLVELRRVNREGALAAMMQIAAIMRRSELVSDGVRICALSGLALLVGWMTRRVRQYERRLEELASQLEARNRDLDAFAGRVAHDLKNAMSPIVLSLTSLRQRPADPDRVRIIAERAEASSRKATGVVDALLAFSRTSGMRTANESTEVRPVVEGVIESVVPREQGLVVDLKVVDVVVRCGGELLHVVLANLVGNAVKYLEGSPEKRIQVSVTTDGDACHIEVADTGPGIPQNAQARIFEPFYRVEGTKALGIGIGLATVHRIVEAHGGRVGVESEKGHGARFHVWLPCSVRSAARTRWDQPPALRY